MQPHERIICALDISDGNRAVELVAQLRGRVGVFKAGLELVTATGVGIFDRLRRGAERCFYDAKLHDIPNTVAGAMRGIVSAGAWCVTVHAMGGRLMLEAAVQAAHTEAERGQVPAPKVLAVTVLTSVSQKTLADELQINPPIADYVAHLAKLAHQAGCDGVIASPHEISIIRATISDPDFLIVTPGVRPAGSEAGDQARITTPGEAVRLGANYLVIGRPILNADDPVLAARQIAAEIASASA